MGPLPHDTINGKVPPGIPSGARSDIVSSEWHERELFVVYALSGRQPGYRTPIHVKEFYSKESPALKLDDFKLLVNSNTMSFSQDGRSIAVEILMPLPGNTTSPICVFFTFDNLGKIAFKRIYAWPQP